MELLTGNSRNWEVAYRFIEQGQTIVPLIMGVLSCGGSSKGQTFEDSHSGDSYEVSRDRSI